MLGLSSISVPNSITFPEGVLWAATDSQSGTIRRRRTPNTIGAYHTFCAWPLTITNHICILYIHILHCDFFFFLLSPHIVINIMHLNILLFYIYFFPFPLFSLTILFLRWHLPRYVPFGNGTEIQSLQKMKPWHVDFHFKRPFSAKARVVLLLRQGPSQPHAILISFC